MQQSLTETTSYPEHRVRRGHRPVLMKRAQFLFVLALLAIDGGVTWVSFYLSHAILDANPDVGIGPFWEFWPLPAVYTPVLIGIFFVQRMYQRRRPVSHLDEFYKIVLFNLFATLLTVALLTLGLPDFEYRRSLIIFAAAINVGLLTVARTLHAQIQWQAQAKGVGDDRVLIVGTGEVGQMLLQKIVLNPKLGYHMIGFIDHAKGDRTQKLLGVPVLGTLADIPWVIEQYNIDEVIIGLPESSHQELVGIISLCEREKVGIRVFPDVFQIMASEVGIGDLGGLPLLTIRDVALQGWRLTLKRGVDIVLSAIALVVASPFLLLMALLVKLDSPGPVFYIQERMGLDAVPFKMIKFRSMRTDAELDGPGWTRPDDPRRTKLGSLMRRFNVDELPQLINVLIGDMSLVGPRPERPVYVEQFRQSIPRYMDRHREKAGITGWAQVNGLRGDTSIIERTKYDLWYIENWSLALDFKILIRTVVQWVFGTNRNAY
ncbi:MAG: undecaprenyl-phosphate glucose phosphotransferase [Chloroflexi bacterium]|nr:MAG: undecaprenyl-phosphate glucose phosphotransferase [Chloroflexota bacterium]